MNSESSKFGAIMRAINELCVEEFERGRTSVTDRLADFMAEPSNRVAKAPAAPRAPRVVSAPRLSKPSTLLAAGGRAAGGRPERLRAPPGTPDALVMRVLLERGPKGASSLEIERSASTDTEKMCSHSGIRLALERGRSNGKYSNVDGRWFLVAPANAAPQQFQASSAAAEVVSRHDVDPEYDRVFGRSRTTGEPGDVAAE